MHMKKPLLAALAALLVCAPAFAQHAKPELEYKLEPYRKTIALHANVAGKDGFFSFDTGGGISLLTPAFAGKTGLAPWGRLTAVTMTGKRIDTEQVNDVPVVIGNRSYRVGTMGVYDVAGLFDKNNALPIDGSLGLDVFEGKVITIDFPEWRLVVESPESLKERLAAGAIEVPLRVAREMQGRSLSVSVGVPSARGLVWMELDSGNGGTMLVAKPYASLFGLDAQRQGFQPGRLEIAKGLTAASDNFIAADIAIEGNIGMPFLKTAVLTLDLANGRGWIAVPASRK